MWGEHRVGGTILLVTACGVNTGWGGTVLLVTVWGVNTGWGYNIASDCVGGEHMVGVQFS